MTDKNRERSRKIVHIIRTNTIGASLNRILLEKLCNEIKIFTAQSREPGFGKDYGYGSKDKALKDQYTGLFALYPIMHTTSRHSPLFKLLMTMERVIRSKK